MIVYTCEDTFEAMMTCIYDAWASKEGHQNIRLQTEPLGNYELFCDYRHVDADAEKCQKVIRSIQKKISFSAYQMVFRCAMSAQPEKLDVIYRFLLLGFAHGAKVTTMLQSPYVMAIFEADRTVKNEAHYTREFLRFQALPNNVLVSHIEPKADILTHLAHAFEDRLPSENWMIVDDKRQTAIVHPADTDSYLTKLTAGEMEKLKMTESLGDPFVDLWKTFFTTIGIKERKNPVCQRNHLPIWYRKHMTEFM